MSVSQMQEIVRAFSLLEVTDRQWLRDIENRPTGSQWGRFMPWQEIAALNWFKLPDSQKIPILHYPECDYYHVNSGLDPQATENIKLLSEFTDFNSIVIAKGAHKTPELISAEVEPRSTGEAWLIVGPQRDDNGALTSKRIVYTAYPGKIAACVHKHPLWDGSYNCLGAIARSKVPIAVKGLKPVDNTVK